MTKVHNNYNYNQIRASDIESARQRMIESLPFGSKLRRKLNDCGRDDLWSWNDYQCRQAGCPACRARYSLQQQRKAIDRFGSADLRDLSMITVVGDVAGHARDIGPAWALMKRAIQNLFVAQAKGRKAWSRARMMAYLEADAITYDTVWNLGPEQQELLGHLSPPAVRDDGGPSWVWHIHGIVHHPGLDWQQVRDAFADKWSAPFQVDVANCHSFNPDQSVDFAIRKIIEYSLKFKPGRWMSGAMDMWCGHWLAEYYSFISGLHSTKSWRIEIGTLKELNNYDNNGCIKYINSMDDILYTDRRPPMPISLSSYDRISPR